MDRRRFLQCVTRVAASLAALIIAGCATQPAPPSAERPLKIGLALGGGAARGFAHIGVISALEAQGIRPDIIVGTSAGSVVGTLYASGLRAGDLRRLSRQLDSDAITDWALPFGSHYGGVLKGEALQDWVNRMIGQRRIDQMPIRLGVVATDLQTGAPVLFQSGNAGQAVRASSSVPGVFQPVRIGGRDYVDGGLVAPVPVSLARQMGADFVIAVNISAEPATQDASGLLGVLLQTTAIMGQTINVYELKQADVVVRPDLPTMKGTDFAARNAAIVAGEQAIAKILPQLREKLAAARAQHGQ